MIAADFHYLQRSGLTSEPSPPACPFPRPTNLSTNQMPPFPFQTPLKKMTPCAAPCRAEACFLTALCRLIWKANKSGRENCITQSGGICREGIVSDRMQMCTCKNCCHSLVIHSRKYKWQWHHYNRSRAAGELREVIRICIKEREWVLEGKYFPRSLL